MTDKELKRLRRPELLEILLAQSREIDALKEKNGQLARQLESRRIELAEAGSIAEAALRLSGIFEKAQAAADLYLESVKARRQEDAGRDAAAQKDAACGAATEGLANEAQGI